MSPPDHYSLSLRCRRKAEQELEHGDLLTAAEMMWGAVVHVMKYVAPRYTQAPLRSHRELQEVVPMIDAQVASVDVRRLFGTGEVRHRYFYRFHLADHQVRNDIRQRQRLLDVLLG